VLLSWCNFKFNCNFSEDVLPAAYTVVPLRVMKFANDQQLQASIQPPIRLI